MSNKTNEPCAAAELIRAQGEQMERVNVLEWFKQMNVDLNEPIPFRTKQNNIL